MICMTQAHACLQNHYRSECHKNGGVYWGKAFLALPGSLKIEVKVFVLLFLTIMEPCIVKQALQSSSELLRENMFLKLS